MLAAALATVAVMVAGSVGPWAYSSDLSVTLSGIGRDGRVTLSLAIGAAVLLLAHRQVKGLPTGPLIGAALVGVVCVAILIVDLADIHNKHLAARWGIVVDVVGSALLIVTSGVLIGQAPGRRIASPLRGRGADRGGAAVAGTGRRAAPPVPSRADWYPDPLSQARLRYWDGVRWTEHIAP
jgi:hypothetical protein